MSGTKLSTLLNSMQLTITLEQRTSTRCVLQALPQATRHLKTPLGYMTDKHAVFFLKEQRFRIVKSGTVFILFFEYRKMYVT